MFENTLRDYDNYETLIEPYQEDIINSGQFIKPFSFRLREIKDSALFDLLENNQAKFIRTLKKALYGQICHNINAEERLEKFGISKNETSKIPITIDYLDFEYYFPEIIDHSINLTSHVNYICRNIGRYLNTGLRTGIEWKKTMFRCLRCGSVFEQSQAYKKFGESYVIPNSCISRNCKANRQKDFTLEENESESYEVRYFNIGDIDMNKPGLTKRCVILSNISYFIELVKDINIEDQVEVLGILRIDSSDIKRTRKEEYEFNYYIEVIDIKKTHNRKLNERIIIDLKQKIEQDPKIVERIITDIYPYTKYIYEYFIVNLLVFLSWITSNSFRETGSKRNSINNIIGGHTGTVKTSLITEIQRILGANVVIRVSGQEVSEKGLVPTSKRVNNEKDLVIAYGAFRYASRNLLVIDEGQYLSTSNMVQHKCLEEGRIDKATDGSIVNAEAKGSVLHLMNYPNKDECYDYEKRLVDNLTKAYREQPSIFERLDGHYAIPKISETIEDLFFMRGFKSKLPEHEFSETEFYNYLIYAKGINTKDVEISNKLFYKIRDITHSLNTADETRIRTPRQRKILVKYLKAIASLHLRNYVIEDDLVFLKKHLIHTIIPFHDNPAINTLRKPDMEYAFKSTLRILKEIKDIITIKDHVDLIREHLKNNFFQKDIKIDGKIITIKSFLNDCIPDIQNKSNTRYKSLLESNDAFIRSLNLIECQIKNKTSIVKKEYLISKALGQLVTLFSEIKLEPIEMKSIIQKIGAKLKLDRKTAEKIIDYINNSGRFTRQGDKFFLNCNHVLNFKF